jgi:hypothetical protein
MGRRFLDSRASRTELAATKNVSSADDDGNLATGRLSLMDLLRDVQHLLHRDPTLASACETLARQLQYDSAQTRRGFCHESSSCLFYSS